MLTKEFYMLSVFLREEGMVAYGGMTMSDEGVPQLRFKGLNIFWLGERKRDRRT